MKIHGTIKDAATGQPLAGAKVILQVGETELSALATNAEGKFEHTQEAELTGETLVATVELAGYIAQEVSRKLTRKGASLNLKLLPIEGIRPMWKKKWPVLAGAAGGVLLLGFNVYMLFASFQEKTPISATGPGLPVGSIIAWHKDVDGTPDLPPGWAECNGQTVFDTDSPYYRLILPDLNGEGRFLRGGIASGVMQEDQMQSHKHEDRGHWHFRNSNHAAELAWRSVYPHGTHGVGGSNWDRPFQLDRVETGHASLTNPSVSSEGAPRHGAETRPVNMSVVWIIKIKELVAGDATEDNQAASDANAG